MKKNTVCAEDLLTMAPADLEALTVDQLLIIQQGIVAGAAKIKSIVVVYESVLNKRYTESIAKAYKAKKDVYGKATFNDGSKDGYIVDVETPKNIKWDEDAMKAGEKILIDEWEEDPEEYVTYKRSISEATFNGWPKKIQNIFAGARTVKAGKRKISIKFVEKEEEAA